MLFKSGNNGTWENGSCGERKYLRKVSFEIGGRFTAVDEIAPCPPDLPCDLPGIINWSGAWSVDDKDIRIESSESPDGRMPEIVPDSFVILINEPISIGEKKGSLVCPYTKQK